MRYLAWDLGQSGIRVNAVSAGPVRTLAARSIAGFTTMEEMFEQRAPLPVDGIALFGKAAQARCATSDEQPGPGP